MGSSTLLAAAVLVAACTSPEAPAPDTSPSFGPGAGAPEPLDALSRRFGRLRARMRERGYREEARLGRGFLLEGESVDVPLDLPVDRCTTVVGLAGGGMRSLSTALYDGEGVEASRSDVSGEGALVHVCPQVGRDGPPIAPYYLVLTAAEGSGAIAAAAFSSRPGGGQGFDGLFEGVLAPRIPFRSLEEALAGIRTTLRARGLTPIEPPTFERVAEGESLRREIQLEPGRCYVAVARGEGVRDVDLVLFDAAGEEVAADIGADAEPRVEVCPSAGGRHVLEARAYEGAGAIGAMVLGGEAPPPGVEPGPAQPGPGEAVAEPAGEVRPLEALARVTTQLAQHGFAPPVFAVREAAIEPGESRAHEVRFGPGCGVLIAAAEQRGTDLDLYVADAAGNDVDRDTGVSPIARASACATEPSVLRVTVKAYGRGGSYALALVRAPADVGGVGRLRLEEAIATYAPPGYAVEPVTRLPALAQGTEQRQPIEIAAGTCVAVAAAGDTGVADVDLFLRDATGRLVASDSRPAPWAAVFRCAREAPETLDLAVRLYRGTGAVDVQVLRGAPP